MPEMLSTRLIEKHLHFVKSVRIWSFFGPYFPAFKPNADDFTLTELKVLWNILHDLEPKFGYYPRASKS